MYYYENLNFAKVNYKPLIVILMTKADIVNQIAETTGIEKLAVQTTVEAFMKTVKESMVNGNNVYLRGFGSFIIKKRAERRGAIFPKTQPLLSLNTIFRHLNRQSHLPIK